jgi:hypothetical protein
MRKFTIDSTVFDLPDDAAIVLSAYLERLEFYVAKGRIDRDQAARAREYLKRLLLDDLSSGTPLSGKEAQNLVNRTEREYATAPERERRGLVGRFFGRLAAIVSGLLRACLFLVWAVWRAIRIVVLAAVSLGFFGLAVMSALALAAFFTDPVIGQQILFGVFPRDVTSWGLASLEAAFVCLAFAALFALWSSPRLWRGFLVAGIASGFVALNILAYLGMDTFYRYSPRYERVETMTFSAESATGSYAASDVAVSGKGPVGEIRSLPLHDLCCGMSRFSPVILSTASGSYDLSAIAYRSDIERPFFGEMISLPSRSVWVEYSGTGSKMEIVTVTSVGAPDLAAAREYLENVAPVAYALSGTTISVNPDRAGQIRRALPYQGFYREVYIRLPESARPPETRDHPDDTSTPLPEA